MVQLWSASSTIRLVPTGASAGEMPRHERAAKSAALALAAQLDSEMSFEERERMERSGMGVGGGLNKGEDQLFGAPARPLHPAHGSAARQI